MKTYGEVIKVDARRVRPFAGQPREYFDPEQLAGLELSIKQRGQIQPGLVKEIHGDPDHAFELVDGQRRWHACIKLGVKFCAVVISPEDEREQYEISLAANFQRAEHTPMEIAKACVQLWKAGRSEVYIAALFGKSPFWVNNYKRLVDLIPELQRLMDPAQVPNDKDRLSVTLAVELCRLEPHEQRAAYKQITSEGYSASAAARKVRQTLRDTGRIEARTQNTSKHAEFVANFFDRIFNHARAVQERVRSEKLVAAFEETGRLSEIQEKAGAAMRALASAVHSLEGTGKPRVRAVKVSR